MKKAVEILKKKWLRQTSLTLLLIAIIIAIYFEVNALVDKLNIQDLDLTKSQIYSLSDESKSKIKNIDKDIKIQLINTNNYQYISDYADKYSSENKKITIEKIDDLSTRSDLMTKYDLESTDCAVIVICGDKEKKLGIDDLYTYEYSSSSYEEVNITEEAITNAILDVTTDNKPKVYIYNTYSTYSEQYFTTLVESIKNDANDVNFVDLLSTGKVPDDCKCIIIPTLEKDISENEKNYLINYINKGGNMVLLQDPNILNINTPNFQAVMDIYGVSISNGIILEQDANKMIYNKPGFVISEINATTSLTQKLNMNLNVCFIDPGKINFKDNETLENLNVSYESLATVSEKAILRNDLSITSMTKSDSDEDANCAIVSALVTKKINNEMSSKLIIYSNAVFSTDAAIQINENSNSIGAINLYNNRDMIVNSIDYLTEKENSITIRKKYGDNVKFTVTEQQSKIILEIIYGIPLCLIIVGYVVWRIRRNKK